MSKVRQAMLTHAEVLRITSLLEGALQSDPLNKADHKLLGKLKGTNDRFLGRKYCHDNPARLVSDCLHCGEECRA
jgi:hypothetical protein